MTTPKLLICLFLTALFARSVDARAQQVSLCYVDWPPFTQKTSEGHSGISVEVIQEASHRAGWDLRLTEVPWSRCLRDVKSGHWDGLLDGWIDPDLAQVQQSFSLIKDVIWTRNPMVEQIAQGLRSKQIAIVRNYSLPSQMEQLKNFFAVTTNHETQALLLTAEARVDGALVDLRVGRQLTKNLGLTLEPVDLGFAAQPLFVSFHPRQEGLIPSLDLILVDMIRDGTIDRIHQKYLGAESQALQQELANLQKNPNSATKRPQ